MLAAVLKATVDRTGVEPEVCARVYTVLCAGHIIHDRACTVYSLNLLCCRPLEM